MKALRVALPLGWGEAERASPQSIRFDLWLGFPALPKATVTDHLGDTIDYHAVCNAITITAQRSRFRLLERLGGATLEAIRPLLPPGTSVTLRLTKENPPIPELTAATVTLRELVGSS